jgi:hypothetical protein
MRRVGTVAATDRETSRGERSNWLSPVRPPTPKHARRRIGWRHFTSMTCSHVLVLVKGGGLMNAREKEADPAFVFNILIHLGCYTSPRHYYLPTLFFFLLFKHNYERNECFYLLLSQFGISSCSSISSSRIISFFCC